ncbi:DUF4830 domain-containing protein [Oscillospiraceae bacterium CM]|nr:DUF4830 domain-containing protein [Oscillospiraceae bacterium CM]
MFIFTTKFNKKKAVLIILALAVVLAAIVLIAGKLDQTGAKETAVLSAIVKDNDQRVSYLTKLGWVVEQTPVEEQTVVIPREFTAVYKQYNALQQAQGFDLSKYGGIEATRYTYRILNYPNVPDNVVADIIVYRNEVIAGDVQSYALDGFMVGLSFPQSSMSAMASPSPSAAAPTAVSPSAVPSASPNASTPKTSPNAAAPNTSSPNTASPVSPNASKTDTLTSDVNLDESAP